jgi:hypothetical protein
MVIFGAGIVTGTLIMRHTQPVPPRIADTVPPTGPQHPAGAPGDREPPRFAWLMGVPPRGSSKDFLDRLNAALQLSDQQRERIKKILDDGQDRTRECWKQIKPEFDQAMHDTREKIQAELTPEQQTKFTELFRPRPRPKRPDDGSLLERRSTVLTNALGAP